MKITSQRSLVAAGALAATTLVGGALVTPSSASVTVGTSGTVQATTASSDDTPGGEGPWKRRKADSVASAHAVERRGGGHWSVDRVLSMGLAPKGQRVRGVATASSDQDMSKAMAVNLHLVVASRFNTIDNVATAWATSCKNCRAGAMSLQLVLAPEKKFVATANRALSLQASCSTCGARAIAAQIVFSGGRDRISPEAERALDELSAKLTDEVRAHLDEDAGELRRTVEDDPSLQAIIDTVKQDTGATEAELDLTTG